MLRLLATMSFLLPIACMQQVAASDCIREQILVRTTDNVEFGIVEVSSAISITHVVGEVQYQISSDYPEETLAIGIELPIGSMLYLEKGSKVAGNCGEKECLEVEAGSYRRNFILMLPQC